MEELGGTVEAEPELEVGSAPAFSGLRDRLAPLAVADFLAPARPRVEAPAMPRLTGLASRLPEWEQQIIVQTALRHAVDPVALAAIRLQENGRPGREFGVLSVPAPRYEDQADVAAQSLTASEGRYRNTFGISPKDSAGKYTPEFWRFFAARWAPIDATNDPQGLNRYWPGNVIAFYEGSIYSA